MQVILDSACGFRPIWGGKKGELRDWTDLDRELMIFDLPLDS